VVKTISKHINALCLCTLLSALILPATAYSGQPLKVFILAGQSNMEGHGETSPISTRGTLEYLVKNDPVTYGHLKNRSNWAVRSDVYIWYQRMRADGNNDNLAEGGLSVGYGRSNTTIGPELQFGNVIGDFYDAPVFILKFASGGKSLGADFRPPSSGWPKIPEFNGDKGYYYQKMIDTVNDFKANPKSYCPAYHPADGYEIAGFGWHQGWNDRVNDVFSAEYEVNMANFIRDVRADLGVPDLPFSISTTGMGGGSPDTEVEVAQLAMANFTTYPLFELNVASDNTRPYWREVGVSPADQGYHWNRNAETYYLIGTGMGEGMLDLLVGKDAPAVDAGDDMITWSSEAVTLSPDVVEKTGSSWTDLTYTWTANPAVGVVFDPNGFVEAPEVTITKVTGNPSLVFLKLEVNNSGRTGHGVINAMQIDVYDTACEAAIGKGLAADNPTDINSDCITGLADFAELAFRWLDGEALPAAVKK
jgi:hypothetical protein